MPDLYTKFQNDGFLIIEDFLTNDEVERLRKAGTEIAENIPPDEQRTCFSSADSPQSKETYFLESANKIRYFYETNAFNEKGELQVPKYLSLNKVGHALHWLHPVFKEISFSNKIQRLCHSLKLQDPVILQSMYIYKNPKIGGEAVPHQDSTFLYTEPNSLVGLWFPLDDCTLENGCLWFIPGSHTSGVHRRYIRNTDPDSSELFVFDKPPITYPKSGFTAFPLPKGACVVIHGNVVHKSDANKSENPRNAYTFHIMDVTSKFSQENWLQSPNGFPLIYSDD